MTISNIISFLINYWSRNISQNYFLAYVIYFRDSVFATQYDNFLKLEIAIFKNLIYKLVEHNLNYKINFLFVTFYYSFNINSIQINFIVIVAKKRYYIRFFFEQNIARDKNNNSMSNILIDRDIIESFNYDFYLNFYFAIQDTTRLTYYTIIINEKKKNFNAF